jgi:hypothetical protein
MSGFTIPIGLSYSWRFGCGMAWLVFPFATAGGRHALFAYPSCEMIDMLFSLRTTRMTRNPMQVEGILAGVLKDSQRPSENARCTLERSWGQDVGAATVWLEPLAGRTWKEK